MTNAQIETSIELLTNFCDTLQQQIDALVAYVIELEGKIDNDQ